MMNETLKTDHITELLPAENAGRPIDKENPMRQAAADDLAALGETGLSGANLFDRLKKKTAFVCSGGGLYGLMTIGAIEAMDRAGITPDIMTGASAGAFIAAMYACQGKEHIFDRNKLAGVLDVFQVAINGKQICDSSHLADKIRRCLRKPGRDATFEDAKTVDLKIMVSDVDHARPLMLDRTNYRGPLWKAVAASCSIPGIFKPMFMHQEDDGTYDFDDAKDYKPGGRVFMVVDGSIMSDMPVEHLKEICPNIAMAVVINVNPLSSLPLAVAVAHATLAGAKKAVNFARGVARSVPRDWRGKLGHTMQRGDSMAVVLCKTLIGVALGSRLQDYGLELDPARNEYGLTPRCKCKRLVGKVTVAECEERLQSGHREAGLALDRHMLLLRHRRQSAYNAALAELCAVREAQAVELRQSARTYEVASLPAAA